MEATKKVVSINDKKMYIIIKMKRTTKETMFNKICQWSGRLSKI